MNSWQEVETKFGAIMHPERLLWLKVCYSHDIM